MSEQEIGTARVHLIVNATDYDVALDRAENRAIGFGAAAERAFDKSGAGVKRAARTLLDYASNLGKTSDQMRILKAAQQGVDGSIIEAAASAMVDYRQQTEAAATEQRELVRAIEEATRANTEFNAQRARNSQSVINAALGVDQPRSGAYLAEQQRAVSALTQQFNQMDVAIDEAFAQNLEIERFRQQLENLQKTAGKTHYELLQMRADQLGIGESFRPMIQSIKDQDAAMGHAGITSKQYQWAMRGLPAQITDIAVSLVSGQPAYLVAIQQGGQIKDMFGGIAPAAKALTSSLIAMINPWTIAATVIGATAYAAYDASRSMEQLAISVAKGDQIAGTAEQMYALADSLNAIDGITLGNAEAAVRRLASGGKLVGENLDLASQASARWASLTGEKVDEVAGKFEAIATGPLEAIEAGQVRVTEKQYEHIKSLVESGKQQEAVNELVKIYYETVSNNSDMVESHLSGVSRYWIMIKDNIGEATRDLGDFANGFASFAVNYEKTYQRLVKEGANPFIAQIKAWNTDADFSNVQSGVSKSKEGFYDPKRAEELRKQKEALSQWNAIADQTAQRELQLNKIRAEGKKLKQDDAAIEAVVARQRKQWAEQDKKKGSKGSQGNDGTQAIRDQAAAEIAAITTQTRLLQSQYEQRQITVEDYYKKLDSYANQELEVTLRSIDAQKAAVAGRKDAVTRIEQLEAQAQRAREQNATRNIDLDDAERKAIQQREVAYRDYVKALDDANIAATRSAELEAMRVGMGVQEYQRMVAVNDLLLRRNELEAELNRRVADGNLNVEDAERYYDALGKVNEQIAIMVNGWGQVDAAQQSFMKGAQAGWQDWLAQTEDVASKGRELMTSAVQGFASGIADALQGSSQGFKNFFDDMHKRILTFIAEQQLTKFLKSIGSLMNDSSAAGGEGFWGSLVKGIGTLFSNGSAPTANAAGGVYASAGLSAYRNTVVSNPTYFPFEKGGVPNIGLMGERSGKPHEAIVPLTRMSSGNLGVEMKGVSSGSMINYNQTVVIQGTPDRTTREQAAKTIGKETSRAMSRS